MLSIARCSGHWRGMLLSLELVVIYHGIATTKVHSFQISQTQQCRLFNPPPSSSVFLGSSGANDDGEENYSEEDISARCIGDEKDDSMQSSSTSNAASSVTMDDGGSDLTDRFKYKVHALMGTYDTPVGVIDDENQTGRIIGAVLNFPTEYTFSVVGKTTTTSIATVATTNTEECDNGGGDYVNSVKLALTSILGSDAKMELRVVPRGTKFTRVSVKVIVESANIISSIYEELGALDGTVMKF